MVSHEEHPFVITSSRKTASVRFTLSEIWSHRELLYFLVWKEVKIRYKQTVIGAAWAVIQPFVTMIVFTLIFGNLAKIPSEGVPYPVFVYSGLVLWTYFSTAVSNSSQSLVANANLLSKVYFPRILLPLSACLVGLLDYAIAATILLGLILYFGTGITPWIVLFFVPLLHSMLLASGVGFWLSGLAAKYRDVQYVVPFFVQILLFATPIVYPLTYLGTDLKWLLYLNPLTGIMTTQRSVMIGHSSIDFQLLGISSLITILIFIGGLMYFLRYERKLADVI